MTRNHAPSSVAAQPPVTAPRAYLSALSAGATPQPYFATPVAEPLSSRRILLLSYHFVPSSAAGTLRWQKFAKVFAEHGWGLDVVALDPSQLKDAEPERFGDLPPGLRAYGVHEQNILVERLIEGGWQALKRLRTSGPGLSRPQPAGAAPAVSGITATLTREEMSWRPWDAATWRRAYFAWVRFAHDRAWAKRMGALGCRLVQPGIHRFVISCGPPQAIHEAGRIVAEATGLPLVVDMRDPWTLQGRLQEYVASPMYYRLAGRAERRIVERASLVVMNTPPAAEGMAAAYPGKSVLSVLNGYDEEPLPSIPPRRRFVVAFAGSIYLDRDPRLVFRAAARVIADLHLVPAQFGLEFIGSVGGYGGKSLGVIAEEEGIGGFISVGRSRPRADAMRFLAGASMLLSLPQDSVLAIPSKIYEYMRFPAWLLALTERGSATDRILEGTGADVVRPDDVDGLVRVFRQRYQEFAAGASPEPIARDARLSRRHQAETLLGALNALSLGRAPESPRPAAGAGRSPASRIRDVANRLLTSVPVTTLASRRDGVAAVFMFHRFGPAANGHDLDSVRRFLEWLRRRRFDLLDVEDLFRRLAGDGPALRRAVALTIDDGYHCQAELAAPLFAEYAVPVTTFLATGFLDGTIWLWWDQVEYLVQRAPAGCLHLRGNSGPLQLDLTTPDRRQQSVRRFVQYCKALREGDRLTAIAELADAAGIPLPATPPPACRPMTWDQARRCEAAGMRFGAHTVTHPILSRTSDAQSAQEIHESWNRLRQELARPVPVFCYPNGKREDFDQREFATLEALGALGAVTAEPGYASIRAFGAAQGRFTVSRFSFSPDHRVNMRYASQAERLLQGLRRSRV